MATPIVTTAIKQAQLPAPMCTGRPSISARRQYTTPISRALAAPTTDTMRRAVATALVLPASALFEQLVDLKAPRLTVLLADPGLQQLRGAQAAERHEYLGPARERGRAELSIPLPIVVVVRGVVAALEPGYSSFVIAGENSAVIEAGEAPRHGVHFTGPSREDHTTQVTYRAPGWAASSACRWVTW